MLRSRSAKRTFCCLLGLLAVTANVAPSFASSGPEYYELAYIAQVDPNTALNRVNTELKNLDLIENSDVGLRFDLLRLKADVLIDLRREVEAGIVVESLAQLAEANPSLEKDPVSLWSEAADLLEEGGSLEAAATAMQRKLLAQELRGYAPSVLSISRNRIASLRAKAGFETDENEEVAAPMGISPMAAPQPKGRMLPNEGSGFREVEVYYATDRARDNPSDPATFYGGDRGELELGLATVTIPNTHIPGMLEAPSIWRLEFSANPTKHVVLRSVGPLSDEAFYTRLQTEFADGSKTEAFVFIHGYNVQFDQAAKRAAQIAYDMDYVGVPILYSWPSKGSTIGYVSDTAVVRLSGRRLAGFLDDLVARSGATSIHIVAHSMGNRALTDALEIMALRRNLSEATTPIFDQILFAAPDVDAGLFVNMVQTIRPIARRLTLYASEQDWALKSSRRLHGNAPRAGQGGASTLADANVDSIDMSELGDDMLSHSYFADDRSALADMASLFWKNADPGRRCGLEAAESASGLSVWKYRQGTCATRSLIDAMAHLRMANAETTDQVLQVLSEKTSDPALLDQLVPVVEKLLFEQSD